MDLNRRRLLGLAAVAATTAALAACSGDGAPTDTAVPVDPAEPADTTDAATDDASPPAGTEGGRVGVAMPTQTSERWIADGEAVKEQLEAAGFEVDLQFANDDIPTQSQQIDQMITQGATVLIIASIDGTALAPQLNAAADAGIKVIAYDRLIRDSEHVDFYVSFDNFKVGVAQGSSLLTGLGLLDESGA